MWSKCFFQTPASLFSLRASSSFLCLLHLLIASIVPSIMCFRRQSLGKMWLIQLFFPHCSVCRMFHSSLTPYNTFSFFTQLVKWSFSAFSNTSFQNCQGISDRFSKMSQFQHSTKLCSEYSISLVVFHKYKSSLLLKSFTSCWLLLFPWHSKDLINFMCTSCITCSKAT